MLFDQYCVFFCVSHRCLFYIVCLLCLVFVMLRCLFVCVSCVLILVWKLCHGDGRLLLVVSCLSVCLYVLRGLFCA